MHTPSKMDAATSAAQDAAKATQHAAASAQESIQAAAHDAAAAAAEAAQQFKDTVREYFPKDKNIPVELPDKSHVLSFLAVPYMGLIIALVVILLSAFIFMRRRQGIRPFRRLMHWIKMKKGKSTILMCGPVDSGKTALFNTLSGGHFQPTQASMQENVDTFKIHPTVLGDKRDKLCDTNFEFIDFPGHPSKEIHLGKFFNCIDGVILLVDATSNDSIFNGAKTLFSLLEKKAFRNKKIPVLICANKIDANNSIPLATVRSKILDELNKLKDNRFLMENTNEKDEDAMLFGKRDEKLTWENLGVPVSFGQSSAKQGNVVDVLDFLEGIQH